ncbi:hypothetical protein OAC75_01180 [Pseudomonadales bacterium]|nr:hypothetical protein [Pseudomonadales bacterium]
MPNMDYYNEKLAEINAAEQERNRSDVVERKAVSNLFFDDNSALEYLAEQRFPGDPTAVFRYSYEDGELVYEDEDGNKVPEFEGLEDATAFEEYFMPNIIPATTIAADIGGGMYGAGKGFEKGLEFLQKSKIKNPIAASAILLGSAALGGFTGNLAVGGVQRTGREALLDSFYNTPPEELAAARNDLLVSSAFSAIPFGAGPAKQLINKFRGKEDSLQYLISLRKDVQGTIDEAAKMGIDLTPAEAADFATRAVDLQYFLSRQPQLTAVRDFYQSRARRVAGAVETFANKIGSMQPGRYGSVNDQAAAAAKAAIKEIRQRRKDRSKRLYDSLEGQVEVDITPLLSRLDDLIADNTQSKTLREDLKRFKDSLLDDVEVERAVVDKTTGMPRLDNEGNPLMERVVEQQPVTDLMALHRRRASDIEVIVKDNLNNPNGGPIVGLREDLTSLLDAADISGTYELARRVYDPTKSSAQLIEQSAIGRLTDLVTDKQTARAVKEIFNPDVSIQSMRNSKRVLKTVDPEGWKEVKKYFIQGKLDELTRQTNELGLPAFSDYFSRPNNQKMMQELLEPEEYQNFAKLIDLMDRALKTVPRGGSATQPLLAAEKALGEEVGTSGSAAARLLLGTIRLPGRLASGQVFDETLNAIKMKQMETYYEALASVLFDPNAAKTIDDAYKYFNKIDFGIKQGGVQGAREGVDAASDYIDKDGAYDPSEEDIERMRREMDALGSSQKPMSKEADVPIFNPLPSMGGGMSSMGIPGATVLPSEQDRELAERLRQAKSGIGGLAV